MSFLTVADYGLQIRDELRGLLTDGSDALLTQAATAAQAEMESYLRGRFDVATIFATTGEARPPLLVLYLVDLALYHLHSRQNPRNVPQIRQDRYDAAIDWLKAARKGSISTGLPLEPPVGEDGAPNDASILPRGGSLPKQRNTY
jgi:phage gp36-like protein